MANHEKGSGADIFYEVIEAMVKTAIEAKLGEIKENICFCESNLDAQNARVEELENEYDKVVEEMEKAVEVPDYTEVLERIAESLRVLAAGGGE